MEIRHVSVALIVAIAIGCDQAPRNEGRLSSPGPTVERDPNAGAADARPSDLEILYYGYLASSDRRARTLSEGISQLRITLGENTEQQEVFGADFTTTRYGTPHSERIAVPTAGILPVRVALVPTAGDTLGQVRFSITLEPDFHYGISVMTGKRPMRALCEGTIFAAPIRARNGRQSDSLFVGSTGLPTGAVC
jgi:hypothetical protein